MIDGPGRKRGQRPPTPTASTATAPSSSSAQQPAQVEPEHTPVSTKRRLSSSGEAARRTLAKLGAQMSLKPAPALDVDERAGRTASRSSRGAVAVDSRTSRASAGTYAAIDLGSSSVKLLVVRVDADGKQRVLVDEKIGCALGKDVAAGADIPGENRARAVAALQQLIAIAREHGVAGAADIPLVTTAVVRNAPNGRAFLDDELRAGLGLTRARVLSGDEEAALGFAGALAMMHGQPGRFATLDLGGGSFQLAIGSESGMEAGGSTQIGSNVVLDTLLAPRARADGAGTAADFVAVDGWLRERAQMPLDVERLKGRTLVATGGVSKFLRAHFGKDVIGRADIEPLRRDVIVLPYEARVGFVQGTKGEATRRALGVDTHEGALDYGKKLPASASLLLHILDGIGVDEVRVSETDARHALIERSIAEKQ